MLLAATAALGGCHRHKIIPEQELGKIFHDAMLVNAYIATKSVNIDSLNIYEPIFEKYGYTTDDVRYTINNFSRRKNARLGDVAEHMIRQFDKETKALKHQVTILDTIDNVANRRYHTQLLRDTAIVIKDAADSAQLQYFIPIKGEGDYEIGVSYTVDEEDKVRGRRFVVHKMRRDSSKVLLYQTQLFLNRKTNASTRQTIKEQDSDFVALVVSVADRQRVDKKERNKPTRMTLHEIKASYQPKTENSVRMLFNEQTNLRILSDTMIRSIEQAATNPAKRAEETASN